jgi:hypothetical protein
MPGQKFVHIPEVDALIEKRLQWADLPVHKSSR